ncbi:hypothetical protein [Flavobacterium sp. GT3P67]|uniref:hypothetical protein n=1 Tax=Flavobacterium sp. GT3P67 TaxID=2541722 RepID=UPI0010535567|nr:hypothetical protein [Flavobacterium sp. GT3P67]TDE53071.1 hypothetical protein E0H99_10360 [Flavobacterium sp. GT3P67]
MKTIQILCILILFTLSSEAQSYKSNLIKTIDTINVMLQQDRNTSFTHQDYALFYPTKINANLQGDVFCIESSTRLGPKENGFIFNLLKVQSFVIKEDEIKALDQNQETIVTIFLGSPEERQALRKELYKLQFICRLYSEQNPKFKCD